MRWQLPVIALAVLLFSPSLVSAYTIVLRGGDRVDIGEFYWLSGSRMTWVTAQGERRAVELGQIDLDATSRHNGEAVSAFIDRAIRRESAITVPGAAPAPGAESEAEAITITTADLAPLREERERDAAARPVQPSALPPVGVPRDEARDEEEARAVEDRWREEARRLREELDAEKAQIDALRSELAYREANPRKYRLSHEYNYGRGTFVMDGRGRYRYPDYGYTTGSTYNRADEEFAQLNSRLIDLEIQHRGTLSRWDAFLERARRAGVPPGWLRD